MIFKCLVVDLHPSDGIQTDPVLSPIYSLAINHIPTPKQSKKHGLNRQIAKAVARIYPISKAASYASGF